MTAHLDTMSLVPKPVPVLLMARELGPGGTERQLTEIARSLDRSQFTPHVACFHEGPRADELRAAHVPVVRLQVTSFVKPNAVFGALQLGRYINLHSIELAHTFDYPLNCFGVPVARAFRVQVVLSSQRAHRGLTPQPYLRVLRWTDKLVDGVVVNSQAVRDDMISGEGMAPTKLHLCYNGIDTTRFHPEGRTRKPGLETASLVVGVVCVLRPEKGLATLVRAFGQLVPMFPSLRLAIVGSGPELASLQNLATELGVSSQCLFSPAVTDVASWMRSIDVFVLPSLSEALSNSLMEAMACGCCVLASRTGGNPELVLDGRTGLLFQPGDADDLAQKLGSVLSSPDVRAEFAERSVSRIRDEFSLPTSVRRMQQIYYEHLNRKNVPN